AYWRYVECAGNFARPVAAALAPVPRPPERMALIAAVLLTSAAIAGAVALSVSIALLHRLSEALGSLAQRIQRAPLRIDSAISVAFPQPAGGIAHGRIGFAEAVFPLALFALLALLALFAALPLLAALALSHAALGKL